MLLTIAVGWAWSGLPVLCYRMSGAHPGEPHPYQRIGPEQSRSLATLWLAFFLGAIHKLELLPQKGASQCRPFLFWTQRLVQMDYLWRTALSGTVLYQFCQLLLCGLNEQPASLLPVGWRTAGEENVSGHRQCA